MAAAYELRFRSLGRGTAAGIVATLLVHCVIASLVMWSQMRGEEPGEQVRDMIVTHLVHLGKPREKFWLPRLVQPPRPKAPTPTIKVAEDPNAAPTPKEAPKVEDADVSKDLRRALQKAQALAKATPEEPDEGSLTGSALGTSTQASQGDEYATQISEAIRRNWNVPTGLNVGDVNKLSIEIRVSISATGELGDAKISTSSGNDLFDDSGLQAVKATGKVPAPPAALAFKFRRGMVLAFDGKDLPK